MEPDVHPRSLRVARARLGSLPEVRITGLGDAAVTFWSFYGSLYDKKIQTCASSGLSGFRAQNEFMIRGEAIYQ